MHKTMSGKSRAVCFTLNNYSEEDVTRLESSARQFTYLVFQRERGTEGGTPHLQGFAHAPNPRALSGWKRVIGGRAHIEVARGSAEQNREYCTKEETREPGTIPFEYGTLPAQGARSDLAHIQRRIAEGASLQAIAEESPGDFIRYHRGIQAVQQLYAQPRRWKSTVFWFYGPTGTGKSRAADERFPTAYWKMGSSKWWDGYNGEPDVIIDDYRRDLCTFAELLRLFDRYPMRVEYKGGTAQFAARNIVVTTPRSPRETWEGRTEEDLQQLLRRIDEIHYFPALFASSGAVERTEQPVADAPGFNPGPQRYSSEDAWNDRPLEWRDEEDNESELLSDIWDTEINNFSEYCDV